MLCTVAIYRLILNSQLMMLLALDLFCKSQILIQTTAMSGLEDVLMILGFDISTMSLKMCVFLITSLMILEVIERLVLLRVYESVTNFI